MITHDDTVNGVHYWAIVRSTNELLVVLKTDWYYEVCGAWECGIPAKDIEIIEKIDKPKGHETMVLYYNED